MGRDKSGRPRGGPVQKRGRGEILALRGSEKEEKGGARTLLAPKGKEGRWGKRKKRDNAVAKVAPESSPPRCPKGEVPKSVAARTSG